MAQSLDAILKGEKPTPAVEQPKAEEKPVEVRAETPEPEQAKADRERDEQGRFKAKQEAEAKAKAESEAPKVETKTTPTVVEKPKEQPPKDEAPQVPVKALQEERRKRQELERQLAALQQPKPAMPDVLQDPQGFQQHLRHELTSQLENERVNMSAAWAREQFGDYDSVMEKWHELMSENPALYAQAVKQDLPAVWAYKQAKRQLQMQEIGDPSEYRSKLEKELREKLEAEISQKYQQQIKPPAPVPQPSLASASSAAPIQAAQWSGPKPLNQILR